MFRVGKGSLRKRSIIRRLCRTGAELLQWDDLKVLLALSRGASFAKAAQALRVDETTVSRRMRRIEDAVGQRLMERGAAGIEPTRAGARLVHEAHRMEKMLGTALSEIRAESEAVRGRIRLTAVPMIAHRLLAPALGDLLSEFPELSLDLIATPERLDIRQREVDIALRFARPVAEQAALTRRVADLSFAVYAGVDAGASPRWIEYDKLGSPLPQTKWLATQDESTKVVERVSVGDGETLIACLTSGLGKAWLPCLVAERVPGLVQIAPPTDLTTRETWLVVHPDLKGDPRLGAVSAWIDKIFSG
ncbi:MAG: LysR family transcriptional regulator [Pseudomonadota bacterium]